MEQLKNRSEAGKQLALALQRYAHDPNVLVLALPRGGVPVAFEIAASLHAPLDVFLVRKLGVPGHEELALGAISSTGDRVLNQEIIRALQLTPAAIDRVTERETQELRRREAAYRGQKPPLEWEGRTIILVDDGLATGASMLAAIQSVQKQNVGKIVVAVPVAPASTLESIRKLSDETVCLMTPDPFYGVGLWYEDFSQTADEEVISLLSRAESWQQKPEQTAVESPDEQPHFQHISILCDSIELQGKLLLHDGVGKGLILFVHGSGNPRQYPRDEMISHRLYEAGFSTLRFDLLTPEEEASDAKSRHLRFDIPLLARRLTQVTEWAMHELATEDQPLGYFCSSTGTAAALKAAATLGSHIKALVSLSGRPDLAGEILSKVTSPTLLLMGGQDIAIMDLNVCARSRMRPGLVRVEVIPQATHLFQEEGALERVANLTTNWFEHHFSQHELDETQVYGRPWRGKSYGRINEYGMHG